MRPNWFVGWPVEDNGWRDALLVSLPTGLRPIHPDDLHMTAAFLGPVAESVAESAWAEVEAWTSGPLDVCLFGLAALGDPRRPTALTALLSDGGPAAGQAIGALRAAIHRATGVGEDDRPPLPHVTVARIPRHADAALRSRALEWSTSVALSVPMKLANIALYVGDSTVLGRSYRVVRRRQLGAKA